MNFSTIKMLRKILSLVIVLCMVTTLFTGCFKKKDSETTPSEPEFTLPEATLPPTEPAPTETEPVNENMATVLSTLKVRSTPSEESPETGILEAGDKVEIIQTQRTMSVTWGYIIYNGDERGWIQMDYVQWNGSAGEPNAPADGNEEKPSADKPAENNGSTTVLYKGTVAVNELNIRKSASQSSDKVGLLKSGARVEILEKKGDWGRIEQGWISLQHVKLDGTASNNGGNNNSNNNTSNVDGNGSTKVISKGIVVAKELNVRAGAGTDHDQIDSLPYGTRVEILEKSGNWGRVKQGWISLGYVFIDGSNTDNKKDGVITGDGVNIRSGPGTNYEPVGSLNSGDEVTILFTLKVGTTTWGNIKQGWVSMSYVDVDGGDDGSEETDEGNGSTKVQFRGIVTADKLTVRKSADGDSDSVGFLYYGDRVEILEESDDWGRTKKGWVNLDYVYADGTGDGGVGGYVKSGLNVRSGPGTGYGVVGSLEEDDWVEILFTLKVNGETWYNIEDGWISAAYIRIAD